MDQLTAREVLAEIAHEFTHSGMIVETKTVVSGMRADLIATNPSTNEWWVVEVKAAPMRLSFTTLGQASRLRDAVIQQHPDVDEEKISAFLITDQDLESDLREFASNLDVHVIQLADSESVGRVGSEVWNKIHQELA